jgi:hypothetical protein
MEFISSSWQISPPPAGFTAKAFRGTPGTTDYKEFDVRIDNDCDLYGQNMPQGKVDIIGIGGQFDTSPPIDSRYQLLPRKSSDITPAAPQVLPEFYFQDTIQTILEGSSFSLTVKSSIPVITQLSCLVASENLTSDNSDFSLQQPNLATFTLGTDVTNYFINILNDSDNENDEVFFLKLRKISSDYTIGQDSVCKVIIPGTTSTKFLENYDFYKNSFNGNLSVKLPNDFIGKVYVFNSMGKVVMASENNSINQDMSNLSNYPPGIYRAIFVTNGKRFTRNFIN